MVRVGNSEERFWLFAVFARAVGKFNQVIYEEVIVELCCQPEREVFDDIPTVCSNSKASEIVRGDMTRANDSNSKASEIERDDTMRADGAFSPVNDDVDKTSLGALRGHAKVAFTLTNDDSPREVTKARRSRSIQKLRSPGGSSRSMGRGRDKELTIRDSRPMRRSRTRSPSQTRSLTPTNDDNPSEVMQKLRSSRGTSRSMGRGRDKELTIRDSRAMRRSRTRSPSQSRTPRRSLAPPQRRSASTESRSRTPKRKCSGTVELQDASLATRHREEPRATTKTTRLFSALRRRATGGKSSKNKGTTWVIVEAHSMTRNHQRCRESSGIALSNAEMICQYEVLK